MTIDPSTIVLTDYEQQLEADMAAGLYTPSTEYDAAFLQQVAKNTMKRKSITIRPYARDILKLKAIAAEEGMPYQTKIISILHQYISSYRDRDAA